MNDLELCNEPTPKGPCTMPKGHNAEFHRHREYNTVTWKIKCSSKLVASGHGRVPLAYAITRTFLKHKKMVIELERT